MHKKEDLPFHYYSETNKYVNAIAGGSLLSNDTTFPFIFTQFEAMNESAQSALPHRHDYFEIIFVEDGAGKHIIDYEPYEIKPPVFYFITKGQIHFWELSKALKGSVMLFPREFLIPPATGFNQEGDIGIFNALSKAPFVNINDGHYKKVNTLMARVKEEYMLKKGGSLSVLRAFTHILLVNLLRIHSESQPKGLLNNTNAMVRQFRQLVSENYLVQRSVQAYADRIGISATHLRDTVKEVSGYSPGQLIRQELVYEAKRRLANTEATTAEIAFALNFEDTSYFSRFFKRETGQTPSKYRNEIRLKYNISI